MSDFSRRRILLQQQEIPRLLQIGESLLGARSPPVVMPFRFGNPFDYIPRWGNGKKRK
jgi:hypothetical protein